MIKLFKNSKLWNNIVLSLLFLGILLLVSVFLHEIGHLIVCQSMGANWKFLQYNQVTCQGYIPEVLSKLNRLSGGLFSAIILSVTLLFFIKFFPRYKNAYFPSFLTVILLQLINSVMELSMIEYYQILAYNQFFLIILTAILFVTVSIFYYRSLKSLHAILI